MTSFSVSLSISALLLLDATVSFIAHINYVQKEKMGTYIKPLNYIHFLPSNKLILVLYAVPSEPT